MSSLEAQWVVDPENWLKGECSFNPDRVANLNLDSLKGHYYVRNGNGVFQKTSGFLVLYFTSEGRTRKTTCCKPYQAWSDSLTQSFLYDTEGRLIEHQQEDRLGYSQQVFDYKAGRLTAERQYIGLIHGNSMLTNAYDHHYRTVDASTLELTISYSHGSVFQKTILRGRATAHDSVVTQVRYPSLDSTTTTYQFASEQLMRIHRRSTNREERVELTYDANNEIESIKQWVNGLLIQEIQFIYAEVSRRISSVVFFSPAQQRMEILTF